MKLAVIDSTSMSTGAENYTVRLLSAIAEHSGNEVTLFTPRPELWHRRFGPRRAIAICRINSRAIAEWRPTARRIPILLRSLFDSVRRLSYQREETALRAAVAEFDVAFYPWPFSMRKPRLGVPEYFCPHDVTLTRFFGFAGPHTAFDLASANRTRAALEPFILEAGAIVSSRFVQDEVRQLFADLNMDDADVVPLARLSDPLADDAPDKAAIIRDSLGVPSDYVLWASNGSLHKNSTQLLSAWWHVKRAFPGAKLVMCGYGVEDGLRLVARSRYFADYVHDGEAWDAMGIGLRSEKEFSAILRGARCVVNTSRCEAGNGNGLDAWDLGVPVVMSDIPPFLEHLEFLRVQAEVFDPMNATSIAEAIGRVLGDAERAQKMAETSRAAMSRYEWTDVAAGYLRVFERAADKRS